jgi:hypothetical protein
MIKIIKLGLLLCTLLGSLSAEAKFEEFQEHYSGYLSRDIIFDAGWFQGQTTFGDNQVNLATQYDLIDDRYSFFIVFGTFSRADQSTTLNGTFDISLLVDDLNIPDPWLHPDIPVPVFANFYAEESFIDPYSGEIIQQTILSGTGKGLMSQREYLSFTINWSLFTLEPMSPVPSPPSSWMFVIGLLLIGSIRICKRAE